MGKIRLKFCGLKTQEEINLCHQLQIDFIGFVFHEPSPRNITINHFNALQIHQTQQTVAVFQNKTAEEIINIISQTKQKINYIQPHGINLKDALILSKSGFGIIKPFSGEIFSKEELSQYNFCNFFLFDSQTAGSGTERDFSFAQIIPTQKPFFLAGGINQNNLNQALQFSNMLDLSSGIEEIRGTKSLRLMKEFHKKALQFQNRKQK